MKVFLYSMGLEKIDAAGGGFGDNQKHIYQKEKNNKE